MCRLQGQTQQLLRQTTRTGNVFFAEASTIGVTAKRSQTRRRQVDSLDLDTSVVQDGPLVGAVQQSRTPKTANRYVICVVASWMS